jgi:predicted metal-binding membrane protein
VERHLTRAAGITSILAGAALLASAAGWAIGSASPMLHPHRTAATATGFLSAVTMWQTMMIAMMTPTVAPWVASFGRLAGGARGNRGVGAALQFTCGYFTVWLAYSVAAAALQLTLSGAGLFGHQGPPPLLAALVLVSAGLFQFAPFRKACLTHCRNPISYLLTRWRNRPPDAFRLGFAHGAYCVGCCWLLMLTGFAVGLMNLAWMALLTVAVAVEQTAPRGVWVGRLLGGALIGWGAVLAWPA